MSEKPAISSDVINALPEPVRRYIMWLETECDPQGTIRENFRLREENKGLRAECEQLAARALPEEMTMAIAEVLSRPNFACASIAHRFRCAGHDIKERSEDEQAFVLFWALKLAIKYGLEWRTRAGLELEAMAEGKSQ